MPLSMLLGALSLVVSVVAVSVFPLMSGYQRNSAANQLIGLRNVARQQAVALAYVHQEALTYVYANPGFTGAIPLASLTYPAGVSPTGFSSVRLAGAGVCTWQSSSLPVYGLQTALDAVSFLNNANVYIGYAVSGVYTNLSSPQGVVGIPCLGGSGVQTDSNVRAVRYTSM